MAKLLDYEQQVRQIHAELIHLVVKACHNSALKTDLEPVLQTARNSGWRALTKTIDQILLGRRDETLLQGLDNEDSIIVRAILEGLQKPASLPDVNIQADPAMAAPGLAHMIHAANRGDPKALQAISIIAEQMIQTTDDLRLLGKIMHRLVDGERNPDALCLGMGHTGEQLVLSLLEELNKLALQ
jgi:hypothetical protein